MAGVTTGKFTHVQRDFSGGEVGLQLALRDDAEFYNKSVLVMENYVPSLQGTAVRAPGTKYLEQASDLNARLIPYITPTNARAVVELTPGAIRIIQGLDSMANPGVSRDIGSLATTPVIVQIAENPLFRQGVSGWELDPERYTSNVDGNDLGVFLGGVVGVPTMVMSSRVWKSSLFEPGKDDRPDATIFGTATVPDNGAGDWLKVRINLQYEDNFSGPDAGYDMKLKLGTTRGANDIWEYDFTGQPGAVFEILEDITTFKNGDPLALGPGQTLYLTAALVAEGNQVNPSTPLFRIYGFEVFAQDVVDIPDDVIGAAPYLADELKDVQFIQSPYLPELGADNTGKELVFTHPNHPPYELVVVSGVFTLRQKVFNNTPDAWSSGNYPAACTSFHGRLILAGSQNNPIPGDPTGSAVETVWGTEVGKWNELITPSDPQDLGVNPDDSIEFTSIYRSPIQWVFGQKNLLVGAREMEYIGSADGIFGPGDLGVDMQSTHGSASVQPVGLGPTVVFAAEGGTRVRAMQYVANDEGWVSPDLTLLHPDLFNAGIVRMVRLRNPHQIVVVVMANGQVALLHQDSYAGVNGWSRLNFNAPVRDACVISDSNGLDVLLLTVERIVSGTKVLYIEGIAEWLEGGIQDYVQSNILVTSTTPTNVITGLEHLEGNLVQVVADNNYVGTYTVTDGEITLVQDNGEPLNYGTALVGLQMACTLTTLPLNGTEPNALKRYTNITVRSVLSSRPLINGERPADRDPARAQNLSQSLDIYYDSTVASLGSDKLQLVTVSENLPVRSEIAGIFGELKGNKL